MNMNIDIGVVLLLIWVHFFADFLMQSDKMAINKSSNSKWLTIHVFIYSLFFIPFGFMFAFVNGLTHWLTDFFSSKATTILWKKNKRHWFFVVIGLDQAVHMTCLVLLYKLFSG